MAESAGTGGYNLNTVSVSEAVQNSTNTITQGVATFGNYKSAGITTQQMLIAGAVVLVAAFILKG